MIDILFNPKTFNYIIMTLYVLASVRWGVAGRYADMCYWASAFCITATVTFGYNH